MQRRLQITALGALLAGGVVAGLGGCGGAGADPFAPLPSRDLSMLELMIEMNPPYLGMQPVLRDVDQLGALAGAADMIASLAEDPRITGYTSRDDFGRDAELFERMRLELLEAARAAGEAARSSDLNGLHDAYAVMSGSCVACHKRFSPHQ